MPLQVQYLVSPEVLAVYVIENCGIAESGSYGELMSSESIFKMLVTSQQSAPTDDSAAAPDAPVDVAALASEIAAIDADFGITPMVSSDTVNASPSAPKALTVSRRDSAASAEHTDLSPKDSAGEPTPKEPGSLDDVRYAYSSVEQSSCRCICAVQDAVFTRSGKLMQDEKINTAGISFSVFMYYFGNMSTSCGLLGLALLFLVVNPCKAVADEWCVCSSFCLAPLLQEQLCDLHTQVRQVRRHEDSVHSVVHWNLCGCNRIIPPSDDGPVLHLGRVCCENREQHSRQRCAVHSQVPDKVLRDHVSVFSRSDSLFSAEVQYQFVVVVSSPAGRILNRISKDQVNVDFLLSFMWEFVVNMFLQMLTVFGVIAYTQPVFLAALGPALILCTCVTSCPVVLHVIACPTITDFIARSIYRRAAIQFQRIDAVSLSPLFSLFSETLSTPTPAPCAHLCQRIVSPQSSLQTVFLLFAPFDCKTSFDCDSTSMRMQPATPQATRYSLKPGLGAAS